MKGIYRRMKQVWGRFIHYPLSAFVGQTAFFFMISAVPLALLFLTLAKTIPGLAQQLLQSELYEVLPPFLTNFWQEIFLEIHQNQTATLLSVTAVAAFWSASKGFVAMIRGFGLICVPKKQPSYFALRSKGLLCTFWALVTIIFAILLLEVTQRFLTPLFFFLPPLLIGSALAFFLLTGLVLLLYLFLCNGNPSPKHQWPGAVITALGWIGFSLFYSLYLKNARGMIYGSLASTVFMMLWLYVCIYILFIGAQFNRDRQHKKENDYV